MDYMSANYDMLLDDAEARGDEALDYLEELTASFTGKFITIKKKYFEKYFPDLLPKAAPKNPTMMDKLKARRNKK